MSLKPIPSSSSTTKKHILEKMLIARQAATKPEYHKRDERSGEFKTCNSLGPGINQLRQMLEGFKSNNHKKLSSEVKTQHKRRWEFVEQDYTLNTSNKSILYNKELISNGNSFAKRQANGSKSPQGGLKLEANKGPILINSSSNLEKKSIFITGTRQKSKPSAVEEKPPQLIGSNSNLENFKEEQDLVNYGKEVSTSYNSRFNFNLKKSTVVSRKIKKHSEDNPKIAMVIDLRGSIQNSKKEQICRPSNISDELMLDLDSSIEREPERFHPNLEKILEGVHESTVNDTTLIKRTEGSLSNISKSNNSKCKLMTEKSFFEDLMQNSRKERCQTSGTDESSPVLSQFAVKTAEEYYFNGLIKHLKLSPQPNTSSTDPLTDLTQIYQDHFGLMAKSFHLARTLQRPPENFLVQKMVYLPPNLQKKKTLVLDLDETLVHCNESLEEEYDHLINITYADGDRIDAGINVRPGLREFFSKVNQHYEIVVFTASQSFYANEVLNILDPSNEWITFRLFKDHCYKTPAGHYIKDLRIFKNRDLQNIVIVDNAAYSYSLQIENGVPIIPFFKSKDDNELDKLADYLTSIARVPDVREKITQDFKVDMFKNYSFDLEILKYKLLNQRC